jgi:hypothetical protein
MLVAVDVPDAFGNDKYLRVVGVKEEVKLRDID